MSKGTRFEAAVRPGDPVQKAFAAKIEWRDCRMYREGKQEFEEFRMADGLNTATHFTADGQGGGKSEDLKFANQAEAAEELQRRAIGHQWSVSFYFTQFPIRYFETVKTDEKGRIVSVTQEPD